MDKRGKREMETFLGGVGVAAISGLAFLAYNHPESYRRLNVVLGIVSALVVVFWIGAGVGIESARKAVKPFVQPGMENRVDAAFDKIGYVPPNTLIVLAVFFAAVWVLNLIPKKKQD